MNIKKIILVDFIRDYNNEIIDSCNAPLNYVSCLEYICVGVDLDSKHISHFSKFYCVHFYLHTITRHNVYICKFMKNEFYFIADYENDNIFFLY